LSKPFDPDKLAREVAKLLRVDAAAR
jgi:hypothetical protein